MFKEILRKFWYIKVEEDTSYYSKYIKSSQRVDLLETQNKELINKLWSDISNEDYINTVITMEELKIFLEKDNLKPIYNVLNVIKAEINKQFNKANLSPNEAAYRTWTLDVVNKLQSEIMWAYNAINK